MSKDCIANSPQMPPNSELSPLINSPFSNMDNSKPCLQENMQHFSTNSSGNSEVPLLSMNTPTQDRFSMPYQQNNCAGCGMFIWDRTLLNALDRNWHSGCLKCYCCGGRLAEMGSSFFLRSNMFLCRQDYVKLFGIAGTCNSCRQIISPDEMVMRCQSMVFHIKCFNCTQCHTPLLPGERYLLFNGSLFCEHEFPRLLPSDWQPSTSPDLSSSANGQASPPPPSHSSSASPSPLRSMMPSSTITSFPRSQPSTLDPPIGMFASGVNEMVSRNPFPGSTNESSAGTQPTITGNSGTGSVTNANRPRQKKVDTRRCPLQVC